MQAQVKELIVALGTRHYRVERPFGDLPTGNGAVSDVAVGCGSQVFALLRRDPLLSEPAAGVIELNPNGTRAAAWGEEIADAHMLMVHERDQICVVDRDAHEVIIFNRQGQRTSALGQRNRPGQPFNHPTDIAFMPDGRMVVSDGYGNALVHVFGPDGEHANSFSGDFITPHAIWPLGVDRVVVADRENHRLQVFGLDGKLVAIWTGFFRPLAIWGDGARHLYVTDSVPSLTMLSETGERLGHCRPVLNGAHGISGDARTGVLYLAEGNPSRLTRLVPLLD
jgi:peptidylglycine monooxygenase